MYGFGYDELHGDYKVGDITLNVDDDNSCYNVWKCIVIYFHAIQ